MLLLATCMSAVLALASANANFTVTAEVVLGLEVKNYNGQGEDLVGDVTIGVFGDTTPVSVLNFKALCEGFKRPKLEKIGYKNTYCHRTVKDMLLHCGDVFNQDGRGSTSIYGPTFNDENFIVSHTSGGVVSMANRGKDTNGSQFFFTLGAARFLDKKHVAFGKVLKGYQYVMAVNRLGPDAKAVKPRKPVKLTGCAVNDVKRYELSDKDMHTDDLEGIVVL